MQEPDHISHFFTEHASGRFTASYTPTPAPGLKNSHDTVPIVVAPQANNAPPLPGAAEHNPPKVDETVGSLVYFNHRKEPEREGMGAGSDKFVWIFTSWATC